MTPQQLIDLRGYGSAEKVLRMAGLWRVCVTDTERIDWIENKNVTIKSENDSVTFFDSICGDYWGGGIRAAIDTAASEEFYTEEENQ